MSDFNYSYQNVNNEVTIKSKIEMIQQKLESGNLNNFASNMKKLENLQKKLSNFNTLSTQRHNKGTARSTNNQSRSTRTGSVIGTNLSGYNENLEKALKASSLDNPPPGWIISYNPPSDGSCGFHAIARAIGNGVNIPSPVPPERRHGIQLRKIFLRYIKDLDKNSFNIKYSNNVTNTVSKESIIGELKKVEYDGTNNYCARKTTFMQSHIVYLIAKWLNKYIFIWSNHGNSGYKWQVFYPNNISLPKKSDNSIFLYLNGTHYQLLEPNIWNGHIYKNSFNNLNGNTILSDNNGTRFLQNIR